MSSFSELFQSYPQQILINKKYFSGVKFISGNFKYFKLNVIQNLLDLSK